MGGAIFKSKPPPAIPGSEFGSESAKRILAEMKVLSANIETWSKKIYEVDDEILEDKFRAERAEFVRRLGVLRHQPRIPEDEQPIISMSPYHREKGKTSETIKLVKRGHEAGKCLCGSCEQFQANTYDLSLCKNCEHPLSYHNFNGPALRKGENTFPRRVPQREELNRTAIYSDIPRTDPSYFPTTLINQAKDAPPRDTSVDQPLEYVPPPEDEPEKQEEEEIEEEDIPEFVEKDKITGTDIEQQLIDAGFSAEAGRGMLTYEDESHYDGEWCVFEMGGKIERHGYGSMHYASGEVHSGDFERDLRHGKGTLQHPDGSVYRGEWKWGEIVGEGKGAMPSEDGSGKYVGAWYNGQRHGRGTMISEEGDSYDGEWYEDMMHGHGCFTANNGDIYTGTFIRGEMEGIGTMQWMKRGDRYEGQWSNNCMNGEGIFYSGLDGSLYRGLFVDGEKVGHGVIELASGDSYSGLFDGDDTDSVFGIIKTSSGDTFQVRPRSFKYAYQE